MLKHLYKAGFQAALEKEYSDLLHKETFEVVLASEAEGEYIIPTIEVFTYKFNEKGYLLWYKIRIIIRRDLQPKSMYEDTYTAMLAIKTFWVLAAIRVYFDLEMRQLDTVNAFCNTNLLK